MNHYRHPRAGGDPSCSRPLDSRPTSPGFAGQALRGNDSVGAPDAGRRTLDAGHAAPRTLHLARHFAICILISAFGLASAQAQQLRSDEVPAAISSRLVSPRFETLGLKDGLSQGSIYQILQDRHGFIWLGTQDGLNRYDGQSFKVYRSQPFDTTTINEGWEWDIEEDKDGFIWVATWGGGLNRFNPVTEKFTRYTHDDEDSTSIPSDRVRSLLATDDGTLWIGTTQTA